jgi:hypothetical protein
MPKEEHLSNAIAHTRSVVLFLSLLDLNEFESLFSDF